MIHFSDRKGMVILMKTTLLKFLCLAVLILLVSCSLLSCDTDNIHLTSIPEKDEVSDTTSPADTVQTDVQTTYPLIDYGNALVFNKVDRGYSVAFNSNEDLPNHITELYIPYEYNGEPVVEIEEKGFAFLTTY